MAAGVIQLPILDATATQRSMQVNSSNAALTGNLSPLQTICGVDAATPASSTNAFPTASLPYQSTPVAGFQQLTPTVSTGLTVPGTAKFALIQAEGGDVRWRDDGTAPTGSAGMRMWAGAPPQLFAGDLSALKFIDVTGQTGTVNIAYYF